MMLRNIICNYFEFSLSSKLFSEFGNSVLRPLFLPFDRVSLGFTEQLTDLNFEDDLDPLEPPDDDDDDPLEVDPDSEPGVDPSSPD